MKYPVYWIVKHFKDASEWDRLHDGPFLDYADAIKERNRIEEKYITAIWYLTIKTQYIEVE